MRAVEQQLTALQGAQKKMLEIRIDIRTRSKTNERGHWSKRYSKTRKERQATQIALLVAGARKPPLPAKVELCRLAPRALDDDNLRGALKAIRDELADWLGLPNDRDPRVSWHYSQAKGKVREYAVLVTISPKM